ncbi:uncharacterized protein [Diadema setosum]|uniref:uncharacterized protein n=1 Tax=Diadema setosum TaxID=31175 RepID=UPI003B3AC2DE
MQLILCVACMILLVAGICVDDSYCSALRRDSRSVDNGHVGKKGRHLPSYSASDYAKNDNLRTLPTCSSAQAFDVSDSYIIRTKDSKENGAYYINAVKVRTFEVCLEQCCLNEVCDTAIYRSDESSSDPNEANCFLFECRPEGDGGPNVCSFTYHKGYVSSIMLEGVREHGIEDQGEEDPRPITVTEEPRQTPKRQTVKPTTLPPPPVVLTLVVNADDESSDCESGHVQCTSGECINELYVCNSVVDCRDGSDEARCSTADEDTDGVELQNEDTHTAKKLTTSPHLPPTNPPEAIKADESYPYKTTGDRDSQAGDRDLTREHGYQNLADELNDQLPDRVDDSSTRQLGRVQNDPFDDTESQGNVNDMRDRLEEESRGRDLKMPTYQDSAGVKQDDRSSDPDLADVECQGTSCYDVSPDREESLNDGLTEDFTNIGRQWRPEDSSRQEKVRQDNQDAGARESHLPPSRDKTQTFDDGGMDNTPYEGEDIADVDGADESDDDQGTRLDEGGQRSAERAEGARKGGYQTNRHLSDLEDRDASYQREREYSPEQRKTTYDRKSGVKYPADAADEKTKPYREQPQRDRIKTNNDWGFSNKSPKVHSRTTPDPPRRVISQSDPRPNPGYIYNSDYYSYYYPVDSQQGPFKQRTQYNNWPASSRNRAESYNERNPQNVPYNPSRNPNRGTSYDSGRSNYNRHDVNVYSNGRSPKGPTEADQQSGRNKYYEDNGADYNNLWNTWPYYYPSSVVDENEFDDDVHGRNSAGRGKPSQAAGSGVSRLRPRPKVHQTNGIPHSVTTHTHPPPTPPVTLSPLQLDIVTKAVDTVDKVRTDTEGATTPRPTRGNKTSPAKEAKSNGLMDDTNEVDAVEVVRGEGMPTAKSAILALVVGLIITVCLLLMVGCRLRYMNQRLRYGRLKTSAHDADYLINGMYL